MLHANAWKAHAPSLLTAALMALQSALSLFHPQVYRDGIWVLSSWRANDAVTLLLAVPLLVLGSALAARGSARGRLLWLGMLYYGFYNNMYYLLGAQFNALFLVYVAICVASALALLYGVTGTDLRGLESGMRRGALVRWVAGWLFLLAATLGVMWIGQCGVSALTGELPQILIDSGGQGTHLVAAMDLTMIVPPCLLAAAWLWAFRPRGYLASAMLCVQCAMTSIVLVVTCPVQDAYGVPRAWDFFPLWIALAAGCLASTAALIGGLRRRVA